MDQLRHMPEFFEAVRARLMKGAVTYEDKSFTKDPAELIEELRQEALDLAGWGFVLYCRLQAMQEALEAARKLSDEDGTPKPLGRLVGAERGRDPKAGLCL